MAAQDYYNPGSTTPQPQGPYQTPQYPHSPVPSNGFPGPSDHAGGPPPPPYTLQSQQYHQQQQQQPPTSQPQYAPDSKQQYPQQQQHGQYYPQYQYPNPQPNGQYYPQQQHPSYPQYQQPRPAETGSLHPGSAQVYSTSRPQTQSQPPYRERSRSGSRNRHHHERRRDSSGSKSKNKGSLDTFVGAGGGAIIGDMIFPGLGTVGGALLGGLGGHKVAVDKRRRSDAEREARHSHRSKSTGYYGDDDRRGRY